MAKKTTRKTAPKKPAKKAASGTSKSPVKTAAKKAAPKKVTSKTSTRSVTSAGKKATPKKAVKKTSAKKVASGASATKTIPKKAAKKTVKKAASKKQAPAVAPKVTTVNPALIFNGNCEEAFSFYRMVFGGNFSYMGRYSEMPTEGGPAIHESLAHKIMHVSLPISKETVLMGNDAMEGYGPATIFGNNFCVSITTSTKEEADRLYNELSARGQATMPMSNTFWGSYFGVLYDRFGISWMINFG